VEQSSTKFLRIILPIGWQDSKGDRMQSINLSEMTREEVRERIAENALAILPFGATEQHGDHLPLGTDTILAEYICQNVANQVNGVVLPAIPFGYSWVWTDNPGTISIHHHNLELFLEDVVKSVERSGFRGLAIINGHGSNETTMKYVLRDFAGNSSFPVYRFTYPNLNQIRTNVCNSETWFSMVHACEFETSLLLAVRSELVAMDKLTKEYPPFDYDYLYGTKQLATISGSGVYGDATLATIKKGRVMLDMFISEIVSALNILENQKGN